MQWIHWAGLRWAPPQRHCDPKPRKSIQSLGTTYHRGTLLTNVAIAWAGACMMDGDPDLTVQLAAADEC